MDGHARACTVLSDWSVLPSVDAFPETLCSTTMPAADLGACRRECAARGYGGFVTYLGVCYFRDAPAEELLRIARHKTGCCLHVRTASCHWQDLFNSEVAPKDWRSRALEEHSEQATWRDLRSNVLKDATPQIAARISQLELLRRLRLDPTRALDFLEVNSCLDSLFTELDDTIAQLERQRRHVISLEDNENVPTTAPLHEICRAADAALFAAGELQRATLEWKAHLQRALLADDCQRCGGRARGGIPNLPAIGFGDLASFLDQALIMQDCFARKTKVLDMVKKCAMEDVRKDGENSAEMDAPVPAVARTPSMVEPSEPKQVNEELLGFIGLLVVSLLDSAADQFAKLKALTCLQEVLDAEPLAVTAVRATPGAHRAICCARQRGNDRVGVVPGSDVQAIATEIEQRCFGAALGVSDTAARTQQSTNSESFILGATYVAAETLHIGEDEDPSSRSVTDVPVGALCRALAHGRGVWQGQRLLVECEAGVGWVTCWNESRGSLLNQDWNWKEYLEIMNEPLAAPRPPTLPSGLTPTFAARACVPPSVDSLVSPSAVATGASMSTRLLNSLKWDPWKGFGRAAITSR